MAKRSPKAGKGPTVDPYSGNMRNEIKKMVEQGHLSPEDLIELAQELQATRKQTETSAVRVLEGTPEPAEKRLAVYKPQYEKLDGGSKARCSWEELESRLLKNNGYYLGLAEGLNHKGVLFGVDKEGNPLFADEGDEPIMTYMDYADTRNRVMYEYEGDEMVKEKGKPVSTGYELFPYEGEYDKSDEIKMYEQNTGRPIVACSNPKESRSIWLESGENPSWPWPRIADFRPYDGHAYVLDDGYPQRIDPERGARRLLRVKKS